VNISDLLNDPTTRAKLDERACLLATNQHTDIGPSGEEILTFWLGHGRYGMPVQFVQEVYPLERYTPLPATPAHVMGLVNIRGRLLTILDIRPLLDLPVDRMSANAYLLILAQNGLQVALLADGVHEVRRSHAKLEMAPSTAAGCAIAWVRGVDKDLTIVLNPSGLLADPRIVVKRGHAQ
jgi:purine-binding chemotaxis protein CheW